MSLIHENAKESFKKTSLVKGDRVPGGGTITQVMRELGGNAYYVQWDDMSWEEGPYSLEELKSGSVAKKRKHATRKTAERMSARDLQEGDVFKGPDMGAGTPVEGGSGVITRVTNEWGTVAIWLYGNEGASANWIFNHGDPVYAERRTASKTAKTVRFIDTAGHTWLGEYMSEQFCPECGLPAVANDEHAYGPFGDPSNYDPDVFPDWKGATKKTAEQYQNYTNYETWGVGLWMDNEYEHYVRTRTMDAQQLEQYARANFPTDFVDEFEGFDEVNWQELVDTARETKKKMNPVGKKVTIQSGPDAGLTGLVSRKGEGGWFIEVEGMETGPYKVASLKLDKTATKKTAEFFEGEEVYIEVDGEMIKGVVLSDDGGPQVEVGDPEDDPYYVGAPAMIDRDRLYRDRSGRGIDWSTAKKQAVHTGDIYNALRDDRHQGYGYAVSTEKLPPSLEADADDAIVDAANALGLDYEDLFMFLNSKPARWMREELADKMPPTRADVDAIVRKFLNQKEIDSLRSEIFAEFDQSMSEFDAFAKKAARGRSWEGVSEETGAVVRFTIEQSPLGWLLRKFVKTDYWAGDNAFKQTFAEDGNDSVEAARATAQQIIDSGTFNVTHDWYDSL